MRKVFVEHSNGVVFELLDHRNHDDNIIEWLRDVYVGKWGYGGMQEGLGEELKWEEAIQVWEEFKDD